MAQLQASDIQASLRPVAWSLLTGGAAQVATDALSAARVYLAPRLMRIGHKLDEENETHRRAVQLITHYQLYARAEREAVARDKLREAISLLESLYGTGALGPESNALYDDADAPEVGSFARRPATAVVAGTSRWRGFT